MIPLSFKIEIEDAALQWQDVTDKVERLADGTGSEAQIVPTVSIAFRDDFDGSLAPLVDPELNRGRARIRITEGSLVRFYLLESRDGEVARGMDRPTVSGRAYAGILTDWRPLTYRWDLDTPASVIAAQVAHQDVAGQAGGVIGVAWLATLDPTIPGKRYSVTKKGRLEIIKEIAEACAAAVRISADGRGLEVYDRPARDLSGTVAADYDNGLSLSYGFERVNEPANAVRVRGEVIETSRPTLPQVLVDVVPANIQADGSATATAIARVLAATGRPVQHEAVTDEAITAGSYTEIPVSGCYSVEGVWLNTGTQEAPVKGSRVTPISFDASSITVPDNGSQLFIVSYTRAETVSWSLADYQMQIDGEGQLSTGATTVDVAQPIGRVRGVYRATDTARAGTDYYTGGSATADGVNVTITLGISPGPAGTALLVDYDVYDGSPVNASISPASSLCDEDGSAQATVGAGNTVGTAVITAAALGQEGSANLALTGSDIDALQVTVDPPVLRATRGPVGSVVSISDEATVVDIDTSSGQMEHFVNVASKVVQGGTVMFAGQDAVVKYWTNDESTGDYRIYINQQLAAGTNVLANYTTVVEQVESDQTAKITAAASQDDGTPVSNGTPVKFELGGASGGASLDISQGETTDGECAGELTAGGVAEFIVRVTCGPLHYDAAISVVEDPTAADQDPATGNGTVVWPGGGGSRYDDPDGTGTCRQVPQDSNDADGSISGQRRLVGCEGTPLAHVPVTMGNVTSITDEGGWFNFYGASAGGNTATARYKGRDWTITITVAPSGAPSRGSGTYEVCD